MGSLGIYELQDFPMLQNCEDTMLVSHLIFIIKCYVNFEEKKNGILEN